MGGREMFNHAAFFEAIERKREEEKLSWNALAAAVWDVSWALNARRNDHPVSLGSIRKMGVAASCQHSLCVMRWLGVPPEKFVNNPHPNTVGFDLPEADETQRLRWSLKKLYLNAEGAKTHLGLTWEEMARHLGCTPSQLQGLRTAKFTTGLELAMRIAQMVRKPAAHFIYPTDW